MDRYPRGKLKDDDEGVLEFKISQLDSTIIIDFGKPVSWLGMPKPQVVALALLLLRRAGATHVNMELPDDFPVDDALRQAMGGS